MSRVAPADPDRDRGALSLMVVVLFVALAALAGIVVDGGAKLTADESAVALAQEAARAGATSVNVSTAYSCGAFVVDQRQALAAAAGYLSRSGYDHYSVSPDGTQAIQVTVTITEPTRFLSLIGVQSFTSRGTATALLVAGVTAGGAGNGNPACGPAGTQRR
ncbi:MAG TPA: TadG family pilus assembly protein [Streptosporangiaceae bacterium]